MHLHSQVEKSNKQDGDNKVVKGIVITADDQLRVQDFSLPLYESAGEVVGGYIEHVNPRLLRRPYCLLVNEEGRLIGLPVNHLASYMYGTHMYGNPIVGDVVLLKNAYIHGEWDIVGLTDKEVEAITRELEPLLAGLREMSAAEV